MESAKALVGVCIFAVGGCAAPIGPSDAQPQEAALSTSSQVTVRGQVFGTDGAVRGGVQVYRLPLDPYLLPMLSTQTDARGSFALQGVSRDEREWVYFRLPGYVDVYRAFETTADAQQDLPATTLLSNAEAAALAAMLGTTLDPTKSIVRVPVVTAAAAGDLHVTFVPPVAAPLETGDGEVIAFDVAGGSPYQVTVTSGDRLCTPLVHRSFVAPDGSVTIGTLAGAVTVAPTMACP